ncbi:unnamed protein product [Angiostrongylus costaricensis]|uniref:Transmembrane protein 231 n=1 Tax=Angiostrongylus costaricensis TaxID=334426 RepID=A0A0R3PF20_ANGCS|nr:unnamed protein product [Angiostrongylus costaricensis]
MPSSFASTLNDIGWAVNGPLVGSTYQEMKRISRTAFSSGVTCEDVMFTSMSSDVLTCSASASISASISTEVMVGILAREHSDSTSSRIKWTFDVDLPMFYIGEVNVVLLMRILVHWLNCKTY